MAITYHFDLYPRDDPRDGTRLVRFTQLQSAEYRGEANGTGAGRISLRGSSVDAAYIDPAGLQYVRVVRDDGSTEVVVGGFFLDNGDYAALTSTGNELLTFGGAGTLSYLAREIMWSHSYESWGQDPFDDQWRLYAQSSIYAGGDNLGSILWRVVDEGQKFASPTVEVDDKAGTAIPDVVMTFDGFDDSNGNAWAQASGEFTAQIGESILSVVKRLMEAGLYISMDPDTFELNAYPADTHRRDRTGVAWGSSVVRFQAPTGGDIATGNIKSDAKRGIAAFIKRTVVLSGGGDLYARATQAGDVPWHGFYDSNANDLGALAQIAQTQLDARDDAGDTLRLRLKLGDDPTNGRYLPFEHVRLDDLVTVHTGTGQWDWNEAEFPVAALTISLRQGGDWDCWVDLGASYTSMTSRSFTAATAAHHTHPMNPRLCIPDMAAASEAVFIRASAEGTDTANDPLPIEVDAGQLYMLVFAGTSGTELATGASWYQSLSGGSVGLDASPEALTEVDREDGGSDHHISLWELDSPGSSTDTDSSVIVASTGGTGADRWAHAALLYAGIDSSSVASTVSATGTGTNPSLTVPCSPGDLVIVGLSFHYGGTSPDTDTTVTPAAGWTTRASAEQAGNVHRGGIRVIEKESTSTSLTPSWTLSVSRQWAAMAVVISGGAAQHNDGHPDLVGTATRATRCDHRHDVHRDTAPTVNDDEDAGYKVGTIWARLDSLSAPTSITSVHILADATAGAAVWLALPSGGAPTNANYLVGTANGSLSAEIVVGTTPGGELGGTWASPTVDATHAGSTHAATQAAAEATAAAALSAHTGDTTDAHDASAISILDTAGDFTATNVEGALAELQAADEADEAALAAHLADTADAHDASAISVLDTAGKFTGSDVETVLAELDDAISAGGIPATIFDAAGDLIVASAADTAARLAAGSEDDVLTIVSGVPAWAAPTGGGSYTDEEAQDAVGAMVADTATVNFTYTDATPELKADVIPSGIKLDDLGTPDDNTDLDASTSEHGLLPKLSGTATEYLDGSGAWSTPAGGGGGGSQTVELVATHSTTQNVTHLGVVACNFDTEEIDANGIHSPTVNPSRINITSAIVGKVLRITAQITVEAQTLQWQLWIRKNGATDLRQKVRHLATTGGVSTMQITQTFAANEFTAGDYLELYVTQGSGATKIIGNGTAGARNFLEVVSG